MSYKYNAFLLRVRPHELNGATIISHILRKSRQAVIHCVADLSVERADTGPKVLTKIHIHFTLTGKVVAITHDFEVAEA